MLALIPAASAQAGGYAKADLLFNLQDATIDESSGVVAGSAPGVLFTHNDSEDVPPFRFFAVGPKGQTLATYHVLGALNTDWEDIARGPGMGGTPSLYLADIGDNFHIRPFLVISEVKEPSIGNASANRTSVVGVVSTTYLIYPEGDRPDSETFIVNPKTGGFVVVTKDGATGSSRVYVASGTGMLTKVGTIEFTKIARPPQKSDFDATSRLSATGGDISPDGRRLVVRTYVEAFEWDISKGLAAGLTTTPTRIRLPFTRQGEAIAYSSDGRSVITTSEQLPAPVHIARRVG
jgi:hypothetical protein